MADGTLRIAVRAVWSHARPVFRSVAGAGVRRQSCGNSAVSTVSTGIAAGMSTAMMRWEGMERTAV